MREIKFRAWGKSSKEFILADEQQGLTLKNIQALADLDSWELTQYTGLKDKDDNEIYEGDIVNDGYHNKYGTYAVVWDELLARWSFNSTDGRELEVIGNIMENPELLA